MAATVWTREAILAAAGIKPIELPVGWHLWGPPHYRADRKPMPRDGRQ